MVNFDALVIGPLMSKFGESVTYAPKSGASLTIDAIFDNGYHKEEMFSDGSVGVTEVEPFLGVQLSQLATTPAQNDTLTIVITGVTYVVKEVRLDGRGAARLMLNKIST